MPRGQRETLLMGGLAIALILVIGVVLVTRRNGTPTVVVPDGTEDRPRAAAVAVERPVAHEPAPAQPVALRERDIPAVEMGLLIQGTVTSADTGAPVPGAEVALFVDDRGDFKTPLQTVTTDTKGTYEVGVGPDRMPQLHAVVAVNAEGFATQIDRAFTRTSRLPRGPITKDFTLERGAVIAGRVVDREGNPVPSATVGRFRTVLYSGLRSQNPNEYYPSTQTDSNGRFELAGIPARDQTRLVGAKERYVPTVTDVVLPGARDVEVVLRPGEAVIRGQVTDETGNPVANVPVRTIYLRSGNSPNLWRMRPDPPDPDSLVTSTDERGYYEFEALLAGWQGVVAGHGRPVSRSTGDAVLLAPGDERTINLRFKPPVEISGIVVDANTSEPIPGVRVASLSDGNDFPAGFFGAGGGVGREEVSTSIDGRFHLKLDRTAEIDLNIMPNLSYLAPQPYPETPDTWSDIRLSRGHVLEGEELRIELQPAATLRGIVLAADETTPVPGASVSFQRQQGRFNLMRGFQESDLTTDGQGRFSMVVPGGVVGNVVAHHEQGMASERLNTGEITAETEVRLVLVPMSSVAGRVTDSSGNPIPAVELNATSMAREGAVIQSGETDSDGFYRIDGLRAGRLIVAVAQRDNMPRPDPQNLNLEDNEHREGVDFVLPATTSVEGQVVNQEGQGIAGAIVTARPTDARRRGGRGGFNWMQNFGAPEAETDSEGYFRLEQLPEEEAVFDFTATHPAHEQARVEEVFLEDGPVTIAMTARPKVEFTAVTASGDPVLDFEYHLMAGRRNFRQGGRAEASRTVFDQTEPVVEYLSSGVYTLNIYQVDNTGGRTGLYGAEQIDLAGESASQTLQVVLEGAITISGRVVDTDDNPVRGAVVSLSQRGATTPQFGAGFAGGRGGPQRNAEQEMTTEDDGVFQFEGVEAGRARLSADAEGLVQVETVDITIEAGTPPDEVIIRMSRGASIYGNVLDVGGVPMAGATVTAGGGRGNSATTDEDGNYRISNLSPGTYDVSLRTSGRALLGYESATLTETGEVEVNFDYSRFISLTGDVETGSRGGGWGGRGGGNMPQMFLVPTDGGGERVVFNPLRSGRYEVRIMPGTYDLMVASSGGNVIADTAMDVVVQPSPSHQEQNLAIRLETVDGTIVFEDDGREMDGQLTYEHRNIEGRVITQSFRWRERRFSVDNQPHGQARASYRTRDGSIYASDWIEIDEGSEKILVLVPEDILGY